MSFLGTYCNLIDTHCCDLIYIYPLPPDEQVSDMGPVEEDKEEVRTQPFTLPPNFVWDDICLENEEQVRNGQLEKRY